MNSVHVRTTRVRTLVCFGPCCLLRPSPPFVQAWVYIGVWIADSFRFVSMKAGGQPYIMNITYTNGVWTYILSMPLIDYHFTLCMHLHLILMLQDEIVRETMSHLFPVRCRCVQWSRRVAIFFHVLFCCYRNERKLRINGLECLNIGA